MLKKYIDGVEYDMTAEEVAEWEAEVAAWEAERPTRLAKQQRRKRDRLLQETDWWALSDRTMTAEQTAYRQSLRDITTHSDWPDLNDDDWPTKP